MNEFFLIWLFVVGAGIGSFVMCQLRRIRYREQKGKRLGQRSQCLECGEKLKWYDNIPIWSYFNLRGKCRTCGVKIGWAEFAMEVLLGIMFLMAGVIWLGGESLEMKLQIKEIIGLALMLVIVSLGAGVAMYDLLWGEMPMKFLMGFNIGSVIWRGLKIFWDGSFSSNVFFDLGLAIAVLSGLYFLLYKVSKEKWVGEGDYIFNFGLALVLGHWWLAIVLLFAANLLASIWAIAFGKKKIFMGPFLYVGGIMVFLLSEELMKLYK